jgi:hypothetical protein
MKPKANGALRRSTEHDEPQRVQRFVHHRAQSHKGNQNGRSKKL